MVSFAAPNKSHIVFFSARCSVTRASVSDPAVRCRGTPFQLKFDSCQAIPPGHSREQRPTPFSRHYVEPRLHGTRVRGFLTPRKKTIRLSGVARNAPWVCTKRLLRRRQRVIYRARGTARTSRISRHELPVSRPRNMASIACLCSPATRSPFSTRCSQQKGNIFVNFSE